MADLLKIGFNPQDRFMMTLGNTLVVVTQDGSVFGADVVGGQLQPVFGFTGAKIGFNPQDRFMMALGNTLVVVTQDGNVFGADVAGRNVGPVFQFGGAKIGFSPQDRFMMALGNTLIVVTQDGNVFGADVVTFAERELAPVLQFSGAKIGFNPQDRFMMALGNTLIVVTQDGNVFGADVKSTPTGAAIGTTIDGRPIGEIFARELQPVFGFSGAKIGFSPQDRFMMALGNTLVVVTQDGNVFGADVVGRDVGPVFQVNLPVPIINLFPHAFVINPELEIKGQGFTPNGRFEVTISDVPGKSTDIHRAHSTDGEGRFTLNESFDIATVSKDVVVPDIRVTAQDESTGRTVTKHTSSQPFVNRL